MRRQSGIKSDLSRRNFASPFMQLCVSQLVVTGLLAMAIPQKSASAVTTFQVCARELVQADVAPERVAAACAEALEPKDLSLCVLRIRALTPILADDALASCTRTRRPVELARCVVEINQNTQDAEPLAVLDHCRRTLLPLRFSECVRGLSREVDFAPARALNICIAAEDFPGDVSPTFAPPPPANPTRPVDVPTLTPTPINPVEPNTPINPLTP